MNVKLPPALEEFIRQKIAAGEFSSVDEIVAEGLRILQRQEEQWSEVDPERREALAAMILTARTKRG